MIVRKDSGKEKEGWEQEGGEGKRAERRWGGRERVKRKGKQGVREGEVGGGRGGGGGGEERGAKGGGGLVEGRGQRAWGAAAFPLLMTNETRMEKTAGATHRRNR